MPGNFLFLSFFKRQSSGTFCDFGITQEIEINPLSSWFLTEKNRPYLTPGWQWRMWLWLPGAIGRCMMEKEEGVTGGKLDHAFAKKSVMFWLSKCLQSDHLLQVGRTHPLPWGQHLHRSLNLIHWFFSGFALLLWYLACYHLGQMYAVTFFLQFLIVHEMWNVQDVVHVCFHAVLLNFNKLSLS